MPKLSSPAPSVPPCLRPESAAVWARLGNYVRRAERRTLLVIRHNSPRLPRELPPLLAAESGRPLVNATVSDAEPDPMAAALRAVPDGRFPARAILSITGAEDLAITAPDGSRAALFEFARRLDLRSDQFLPDGGLVLVWATARVFDALAEHSLNFISRAAAVLTLAAAGEKTGLAPSGAPSISRESMQRRYAIPPLPPDAPAKMRAALGAFEELAVANELYLQGGPRIAHALAAYDAARDRIEAGWEAARQFRTSESKAVKRLADALLAAFPIAGIHILSLRQGPREHIAWLEVALDAAREIGDRRWEGVALGNLALAHADLGDARKAIALCEQALVIARDIGDRRGEANALFNSALQLEKLDQRADALARAEQAAEIYAAIESPHTEQARQLAARLRGGA